MSFAPEKMQQYIGFTRGCEDHDRDLVHELSKRLDALWRYDQYIANAEDHPELEMFWLNLKQQELVNVTQLKELIAREIANECF